MLIEIVVALVASFLGGVALGRHLEHRATRRVIARVKDDLVEHRKVRKARRPRA